MAEIMSDHDANVAHGDCLAACADHGTAAQASPTAPPDDTAPRAEPAEADPGLRAVSKQRRARCELAELVSQSAGERVSHGVRLQAASDALSRSSLKLLELEAELETTRRAVAAHEERLAAMAWIQQARRRHGARAGTTDTWVAPDGDGDGGSGGLVSERIRAVRTAAEAQLLASQQRREQRRRDAIDAIDAHLEAELAASVADVASDRARAEMLERAASLERSLLGGDGSRSGVDAGGDAMQPLPSPPPPPPPPPAPPEELRLLGNQRAAELATIAEAAVSPPTGPPPLRGAPVAARPGAHAGADPVAGRRMRMHVQARGVAVPAHAQVQLQQQAQAQAQAQARAQQAQQQAAAHAEQRRRRATQRRALLAAAAAQRRAQRAPDPQQSRRAGVSSAASMPVRGVAAASVPTRRAAVVPASAAEIGEARAQWLVQMDDAELQRQTDGDIECVICLDAMEAGQQLVCLPCNDTSGAEGGGGGGEDQQRAKAHLFHEACLSRWLLASAACPTCRRPVRGMLKRCRH